MNIGTRLGEVWDGIIGGNAKEWSIVNLGPSESTTGDGFRIDASYLSLSISSMRLVNRKELLTKYLPFAAFALEIPSANGTERSIPIVFDPRQKIEEILKTDSPPDALPIEGVLILKSLPVTFNRFNLLGGLFRRQSGDMGDIVLQLLSGLSQTSIGAPVGSLVEPAKIAYSGLKALVAGPEVQMQVGTYRGFGIPTTRPKDDGDDTVDMAQESLRPGRIAFIAGENFAAQDLVFDQENLTTNPSGDRNKAARLAAADSFVITVEATPRRQEYKDLPCHAAWLKIADLIWEDKFEEVEKQHWPRLGKSIVVSDALVESEKTDLLQIYVAKYQNEVVRRQRFLAPLSAKPGAANQAVRGTAVASVSGRIRRRALNIADMGRNAPEGAEATAKELKSLAKKIEDGKLELVNGREGADKSPPNMTQLDTVRCQEPGRLDAKNMLASLTRTIYD